MTAKKPARPQRQRADLTSRQWKWCPLCAARRPVKDFNRSRAQPDGLQGYCREHHGLTRKKGWTARLLREDEVSAVACVWCRDPAVPGYTLCPACAQRVLRWHLKYARRFGALATATPGKAFPLTRYVAQPEDVDTEFTGWMENFPGVGRSRRKG